MSTAIPQSVKTRKVKNRRKVHYDALDEVLVDAERLTAAGARTLGNWSKGQIFRHLSELMHASIDGFPVHPALPIKIIGRLCRPLMLRYPMPSGFKLPAKMGKFIPAPLSDEEGLRILRETVARMRREPKRVPSPLIGRLSVAQWEQFHCRHAELHMSFIAED